jgi:hypothetical protein
MDSRIHVSNIGRYVVEVRISASFSRGLGFKSWTRYKLSRQVLHALPYPFQTNATIVSNSRLRLRSSIIHN